MLRLGIIPIIFLLSPFSIVAKETISVKQAQQLGQHSLSFIENKGQVRDQFSKPRNDIQFKVAAGNGLNVFVGNGQMHYQWSKQNSKSQIPNSKIPGNALKTYDSALTTTMYRMDVELVGANKNAEIITEEKQDYYETYYTAPFTVDKGGIVHSYKKITYRNIYPNIDWVLYLTPALSINGKGDILKYDFVERPGGDVKDIKLKYGGASNLLLNADGSITASTPMGSISEQKPTSFEKESTKPVASMFILQDSVLSFDVGQYNGTLVIDPALSWCTYFGGSGEEGGGQASLGGPGILGTFLSPFGLNCDASGNPFICGFTFSTNNIATIGAYQGGYTDSVDAFLAKFSPSGALLWATYYGGSGVDVGVRLTVDGTGNPYMTGYTKSSNNIASSGAFQTIYGGDGTIDAFVAKFNGAGALQWATYYGDSTLTAGEGIVCDGNNNVYMAGRAEPPPVNNITTVGSYQSTYGGGGDDAFIVKFNSSGARQWATYFGGNGYDWANNITRDINNNIYIAGYTTSTNNIASPNCYQSTPDGNFLAKFNSSGVRQWSTYFTGVEIGNGVSCDPIGNVYIAGSTVAHSGVATPGAYQTSFPGSYRACYLAKFNNLGSIQWATYYGGGVDDLCLSMKRDNYGNVYFTGQSFSSTGIATAGSYQTTYSGGAFFAKFNINGQRLYGTYFPTIEGDGITCDVSGNIYLGGITAATLPTNSNSYQSTSGGGLDVFLAKFSADTSVFIAQPFTDTLKCAGDTINIPYIINYPFHSGNTFTIQLSNDTGNFTSAITIGAVTATTAGSVICTIPASTPTGSGYRIRIISSSPVDTSVDEGLNIHIFRLPNIYSSSNSSPLCFGDTLHISITDSAIGVSYSWTGSNTFNSTTQNISRYLTALADSGYYYLSMSLGVCHVSDTFHVIVKPLPVLTSVSSNSPVCPSTSLNFSASGTSGASYQWSGPNLSSTQQNPVINPVHLSDSGNYNVYASLNGCASARDTIQIIVSQGVDSLFANSNSPLCAGDVLHINSGSSISGVSYSWSGPGFSSSSPNFAINGMQAGNAGNYYLTASLGACTAHDTLNVVVKPLPNTPIITSNSPVCEDSNLELGIGNLQAGVSYQWQGPNLYSSAISNPVINNIQASSAGTYTITALLGNCGATAATTVTVKPLPVQVSITNNSPVCVDSNLELGISNLQSGVSYEWTGPAYSSASSSVNIANASTANSGTYYLSISLNGCSVHDTVNAVVKPLPNVPSITSNSPLCEDGNLALGIGNLQGGVNYSWVGPGFSSAVSNPAINNIQLGSAGNYIVSAMLNGCTSKDSVVVVVNPKPASVTANSNSLLCEGDNLQFTMSSLQSGVNYGWTGPNNFSSAIGNPFINNVQQNDAGTYTVILSLNGCKDTLSVPVVVNPGLGPPFISISVFPGDTVCAGTNLTFTANAGNAGNPVYTWLRNGINIPIGNVPSFTTSSVSNGDHITCVVSSNSVCQPIDTTISNTIHLDIISIPPPAVSISTYPLGYSLGDLVTFSGHPPSSSQGLTFAWTVNGVFVNGNTSAVFSSSNISPADVVCFIAYSPVACTTPDSGIACAGTTGVTSPGLSKGEVIVWPNPVTNELFIEGAEAGTTISIYNIVGQRVYRGTINQSQASVDTKNFLAGNYILELTNSDGERVIKKIVK